MTPIVETLTRQFLLINLIKRRGTITRDEIFSYLETESGMRAFQYPEARASRNRLLQRDIEKISTNFGIDIEKKGQDKYSIAFRDPDHVIDYERFFTDFDMLTSLSPETELCRYVVPERSRFTGSEYLSFLLTKIKHDMEVEFDYTNVRKGNAVKHHCVEPYFLKEDQRRWYLIGVREGVAMIFALDRISNLKATGNTFSRNKDLNPVEYFRDSYGIWVDTAIPVEEVELSYSPLDGSFLRSVPLHPSQQIIADNDEEFRITVRLRVTNDFIMALLSRSRSLTVIRPQWLREEIKKTCAEAASRNS